RYAWARLHTQSTDLAPMRARWVQDGGARLCHYLRVELDQTSPRPLPTGLIACNHISYLDIPVIAAHFPCAFISKAEVKNWPLFGWLAQAAGSLFLKRESRTATRDIAAAMRARLHAGERLVVFPEGTSSDGSTVLPFRPALFAAAIEARARVVPAALTYHLDQGTVARDIAYWGDMTLFPHLCHLLGQRRIRARFTWGLPIDPLPDRKQLAAEAHRQVLALHSGLINT
ncbi:MAG: lysophospholipid acyltransferase family protein, partial [Verrucomicrobiia bacterium]